MRRIARASVLALSSALALTAGLLTMGGSPALAAACGTAIPAGTTCSMTGTVSLTAGSLTLTSPASLSWASTLTGLDQSLVDGTPGDQQLTVNDATGSGSGWHITTSATTFTNGTHTFANTGTFVFTGSVSSVTSTSAPTATCVATCTLPTNTTTYPVAITTAAASPTPSVTYDTAAGTGLGQVILGGSAQPNPVGWWVNVPSSASSGSYTSTITMEIISGP
jgi:hypothetical protein